MSLPSRSHRLPRSQSSNALSHAFWDARGSKHQPKPTTHGLSLVKDEDEDGSAAVPRVSIPSSPLRESQTFDAADRLAMMASSSPSKALRRRSGEVVSGAARSAAQATKRSLRVIRRAGSFDVASKTSTANTRSRSNSSSSLLTSLGLVSMRHQRSQTLHELDTPFKRERNAAATEPPASLSLPASAPHSPRLHGLGLSADSNRAPAWRFSQITEADENISFSKDLPHLAQETGSTPSSESDQGLQLHHSNSSGGSVPDARSITPPKRDGHLEAQARSPTRSERERRQGLAKRSYAALIDLLNPALHKETRPIGRGRQHSLNAASVEHTVAHGTMAAGPFPQAATRATAQAERVAAVPVDPTVLRKGSTPTEAAMRAVVAVQEAARAVQEVAARRIAEVPDAVAAATVHPRSRRPSTRCIAGWSSWAGERTAQSTEVCTSRAAQRLRSKW